MIPRDFDKRVAEKNTAAFTQQPGDIRRCVNAILTLDAFFGILHAHLYAKNAEAVDGKEER